MVLGVIVDAISDCGDSRLSFALECCEVDNVVKEGDGHISLYINERKGKINCSSQLVFAVARHTHTQNYMV